MYLLIAEKTLSDLKIQCTLNSKDASIIKIVGYV